MEKMPSVILACWQAGREGGPGLMIDVGKASPLLTVPPQADVLVYTKKGS